MDIPTLLAPITAAFDPLVRDGSIIAALCAAAGLAVIATVAAVGWWELAPDEPAPFNSGAAPAAVGTETVASSGTPRGTGWDAHSAATIEQSLTDEDLLAIARLLHQGFTKDGVHRLLALRQAHRRWDGAGTTRQTGVTRKQRTLD
jgi:hypothetical protein